MVFWFGVSLSDVPPSSLQAKTLLDRCDLDLVAFLIEADSNGFHLKGCEWPRGLVVSAPTTVAVVCAAAA